MANQTTSETTTNYLFYVEGKQVYPCRCGKIHDGAYAVYDYEQHNCLHECDLMGLPADEKTIQAICPECGKSWKVDMEGG